MICACRGCKNDSNGFRFCWAHRNNVYYDFCHVHGRTKFKNYRCVECKKAEKSIYTLVKNRNDGKIRIGRCACPRWATRPIKELYELRYKLRIGEKMVPMIVKSDDLCPNREDLHAIYGIFNKHTNECYYVGQTFHYHRRREEHICCMQKTKNGETKNIPIWYKNLPEIGSVVIRCLYHFPDNWFNKLKLTNKLYMLAVAEQWGMDTFKPSQNVVQARMTKIYKTNKRR